VAEKVRQKPQSRQVIVQLRYKLGTSWTQGSIINSTTTC